MARLIALMLTVVVVAFSLPASGENWPSRPIRLVVPYPPGGPTDLVGRLYAAKFSELCR